MGTVSYRVEMGTRVIWSNTMNVRFVSSKAHPDLGVF